MINYKEIKNIELFYDFKVTEQCRSCKHYGKKATCPPYAKVIYNRLSYKNGIIVYKKFEINDPENWKELSRISSLEIHMALLEKREKLINEGHYFCVIYGAGSCKLCNKCSFPCRFPERSIIPIEARGLDVVKLVKKYIDIDISFPVKDFFYRIGLILYD